LRKRLRFLGIIFCVVVLLLIGIFRSDVLLLCIYLLTYPYLIATGRGRHIELLLLSTIFSVVWLSFSTQQYGYNDAMLYIFGLPAFPLLAWAGGLFASFLIHRTFSHWLDPSVWYERWALFLAIYWGLLLFLETGGYHVANIHNVSTSMYPGLPVCDCMHAPRWMQASYFLMGPAYFGVVNVLLKKNKVNTLYN
jgi:hypothetical protein